MRRVTGGVYEEIRSPNYEKTIVRAGSQLWSSNHVLAHSLWPRCVFESERRGFWYLYRRDFPFLRAELMLAGELVYEVDGRAVVSRRGELHVTPAGHEVRVVSSAARYCHRIGVELGGKLLARTVVQLGIDHAQNLRLKAPEQFERRARQLSRLLAEKRGGTEAMVSTLCYELLAELSMEAVPEGGALPPNLAGVLELIHASPDENFPCDELARRAGCSAPTLVRLFRKHLNTTPREYANRYRMEHARQLLLLGEFSVKEVAARLGFRNQFYFSRLFRRCFGVPPSQTR